MVARLYWVVARWLLVCSWSLLGCFGWLLSGCHNVMGGDHG